MRPGGRTPGRRPRRARVPQHQRCAIYGAAAPANGPTGDRGGRFRSAPPPPLRHDHHGCRDRPTRRGPARPRRGHPGVLAARTPWCRGRVPGRLGHLRRGCPPCPARRGAGQRSMAPLAKSLRQSPARSPRARRMLGHHQPAPPRRSTRADHPRTLEQGPRSPRPGRRPARLFPPPRRGPEHGQTLCPHARTQALRIAPLYRPTLVDPYRDHLRARRAADPRSLCHPPAQGIRELGYTGSAPTCWSGTSTRAALKATAPSQPPVTPAASCSPSPKTCARRKRPCWKRSPQPARR